MDSTIEGLMNHCLENCGKGASPPFSYFPLFLSFAYPLSNYFQVCLESLYFYFSSSSLVLSIVMI